MAKRHGTMPFTLAPAAAATAPGARDLKPAATPGGSDEEEALVSRRAGAGS